MKTQNRSNKRFHDCMQNLLSYHSIQYFCFAFVPRTIFFLCFGGLAYAGWLESYITPTTWIGIFALWILILFYPPKNQINVWGTYSIILLTLAFTSIISYENLTLSFYQWSFILFTHFLTLKTLHKSSKSITQKKPVRGPSQNTAKYICVFAILLLLLWFFYPHILFWLFPEDSVKAPYDNLGSLLTGGALIISTFTVCLQMSQIKNDREKFKKEFDLAQSQKIDSYLFDYWKKYDTLKKECGSSVIDEIYKKLFIVYFDINENWTKKSHEINPQEIFSNISFFFEQVDNIFCLSKPFKIFISLVNLLEISPKEKSDYYCRFLDLLPLKEKAIILTYILCCENSCKDTAFYKANRETFHRLFNIEYEINKSTDTFLEIAGYIIGYSPDNLSMEDLHNLIMDTQKKHANYEEALKQEIVYLISDLP